MSEQVSVELFDQFRASQWPHRFNELAQKAKDKAVDIERLQTFRSLQLHLRILPAEERSMLEDMGMIESYPSERILVTPKILKDGVLEAPGNAEPRFSDFGREVIMKCEHLHTTGAAPKVIRLVD